MILRDSKLKLHYLGADTTIKSMIPPGEHDASSDFLQVLKELDSADEDE